jgi:carbohydrate-binding DOMON domain-containing protein
MYYGNTLQAYNTSSVYGVIADYPVTMRATPTVSQSGDFGAFTASSGNNGMATTIGNFSATSHAWRTGGWSGNSNLTAGHAVVLFALSNAKLIADAEL